MISFVIEKEKEKGNSLQIPWSFLLPQDFQIGKDWRKNLTANGFTTAATILNNNINTSRSGPKK